MKLYELAKRDVLVKLVGKTNIPPLSLGLEEGEVFLFHHLDGMYSYSTDKYGNVLHPAAWTDVEIVDMYPRENWGEQYGN